MEEEALADLVFPSIVSQLWLWFFRNHILFSLFAELVLVLPQVCIVNMFLHLKCIYNSIALEIWVIMVTTCMLISIAKNN